MTTGAERETAFDPTKPFTTRAEIVSVRVRRGKGRGYMTTERVTLKPAAPVAQPGTEDAESDAAFVERIKPVDYEQVTKGEFTRLIALAKRGLTGDRS